MYSYYNDDDVIVLIFVVSMVIIVAMVTPCWRNLLLMILFLQSMSVYMSMYQEISHINLVIVHKNHCLILYVCNNFTAHWSAIITICTICGVKISVYACVYMKVHWSVVLPGDLYKFVLLTNLCYLYIMVIWEVS